VQVDFTYEATGMCLGPFEFLHVPGHCAGHVVIRLHNTLFAGDLVLQGLSPHQSPESITLHTGLDHYLKSLDAVEAWANGVNLTLGGHRAVITDLSGRLNELREMHRQRLEEVLELLREPHTIVQVSQSLFVKCMATMCCWRWRRLARTWNIWPSAGACASATWLMWRAGRVR